MKLSFLLNWLKAKLSKPSTNETMLLSKDDPSFFVCRKGYLKYSWKLIIDLEFGLAKIFPWL